jgi:galactokinase
VNGVAAAPGRVNLIGEHIDYHGLAVLPIALAQRIRVEFQSRDDRRITARSSPYGTREFEWSDGLGPVARGDWENYLRAAARVARSFLPANPRGIDAEITSDLPAAAGLSSSSALIVAFTLGLLRANGYNPTFEELMEVLPDGEQFVGTRGGGMDHAASLGSRAGHASLIGFNPVTIRHVPIPPDWTFLVVNSGIRAEKSGPARDAYNARRNATVLARDKMLRGEELSALEAEVYPHVTSEAERVNLAVTAMERGEAALFGRLMRLSHESLRQRLKVSLRELDVMVETAVAVGALGARLTGAGFGGCIVVLAQGDAVDRVRRKFGAACFDARASDGALI